MVMRGRINQRKTPEKDTNLVRDDPFSVNTAGLRVIVYPPKVGVHPILINAYPVTVNTDPFEANLHRPRVND